MSHEIDTSTGNPAFAFSIEDGKAWHGLGTAIPESEALDPRAIAARAGAAYGVYKAPVSFTDATGRNRSVPNREAIVRDDTHEPLEVLSGNKYKVVQPAEYFEAFRDSLAANNLRISSAGVLKGGRIVFVNAALSDTGHDVLGIDRVSHFVCMGGGYDGALASFGYLSSLRTVCWNTLSANLAQTGKGKTLFRVPHSAAFDGRALGAALGLLGPELAVQARVFNTLAGRQLARDAVARYFADVLEIDASTINAVDKAGKPVLSTKARNQLQALADAYLNGPGAQLASASGTAWGALNAVTHWVDHVAATRDSYADGAGAARFASAQFGQGASTKARALRLAMDAAGIKPAELVAA